MPPSPARSQPTRAPALSQHIALAAQGLLAVEQGQSAREAVAAWPATTKPGAQALLYHTLRHWGQAQALIAQLAQRKPHAQVRSILAVALTLLLHEHAHHAHASAPHYSPFTIVDQAVHAVRQHKKSAPQAGFVNACLRRFLREREALLTLIHADALARWNHPTWWIEAVQNDHASWQAILIANNQRAPLTLRVNTTQGPREAYLAQLQQAGIAATPVLEAGIVLAHPVDVRTLPGYTQGRFAVQDAAAQLAAPLLLQGMQAQQGQPLLVLDACAAPGGKTTHLLEWAHTHQLPLELLAIDADAQRCVRITENLQRLHPEQAAPTQSQAPMPPTVRIHVADATRPEQWHTSLLGGRLLDALLLDAPCSASGIVRRHPDIRWLRRASDIDALAHTQALLLRQLWPLLKPGGRLLYCTCSIFHREGRAQIRTFLHTHSDAALIGDMLQLLPTSAATEADAAGTDHDGFFYALLHKHPKITNQND